MARIESGRVELDESYARIDQTVDEIKVYLNLRLIKRTEPYI